MRKFSMRLTFLCTLVLLVCVTALAISGQVSNLKRQDTDVRIDPSTSETGDPVFHIAKEGLENGKQYLVVIRSGAEQDKLSEDNLVYMDMVKAEGGSIDLSNVYPKDMDAGTYRVYLSDYGQDELKQVATFDYGSVSPSSKRGDVDGNGNIDMDDAIAVMRHVVKLPGWDLSSKADVADIDRSGAIDMDDAIIIMRHVVKLLNIEEVYGR